MPAPRELTEADRWILGRLGALVSEVDGLFEDFQFAKVAGALYQFTWNELCDWYLELAKVQLYQGDRAGRGDPRGARARAGHGAAAAAPVHPVHHREAVDGADRRRVPGDRVVAGAFEGYADAMADARIADVQKLVTEIRRFRADQGLKPGQKVAARLAGYAGGHEEAIRSLVRLTAPTAEFAASASLEVALADGVVTVELDLSGTVDVAAERKRLQKDLAAAQKELSQTEAKLGNEAFIAKAPAQVVDKIKLRRETAVADIDRITARLAALPAS